MKQYILFDNDGVLVDTEHYYFKANVEILQKMGITLTLERYRDIMIEGQSAFLLAKESGFDEEAITKARAQRDRLYQHYLSTENIEIKGVKEVLQRLSSRYKMAIITSSRREDFELIHAKRGIVDYMEFVLCSGEYEKSKPYPHPYLKALELFNASKEEAIVVEDSQRGLTSAYRAGIECVVVQNDFTSNHDLTLAKHKIDRLSELEELLLRG